MAGIFLLAYLFTLSCVYESEQVGRLSSVPYYDDVGYFRYGVDISENLHEKGAYGAIYHLQHYGAHAPFSEFLAGLTVYFNGYSPKAIYTANVFVIIIYLCFLVYFFNSLKTPIQFALLACFLSLPFATMSVVEFRPDMAWAIWLGFTAIFVVTRRDYFQKISPTIWFGLLISFTLLTKPTTFPMTLMICGLGFSGRLVLEFFQPSRPSIGNISKRVAVRLLVLLGIITLVAGPYIYFFGRAIWEFFWDNMFGKQRSLWDSFSHYSWNYYIWGFVFQSNLNYSGLVLICATFCVLLIYRKRFNIYDITELAICFALIFTALVINSTARVADVYLGGAFYGTLIFTMAFILGRHVPGLRHSSTTEAPQLLPQEVRPVVAGKLSWAKLPECFVGVLLLLCVLTYRWPPCSSVPVESGRFMRDLHEKLYDYISRAPIPSAIFVTQAGPAVLENIRIWIMLHHQKSEGYSLWRCVSLNDSWALAQQGDLIIAQNKGFQDATSWLPAEQWQDVIVDRLKKSSDYRLVFTYPDQNGKALYIFRRVTTDKSSN